MASLIYFGPYLKPPVGLFQYMQFNNGLPESAKAIIKTHPGFAALFIEPEKLRDTMQALKRANSPQAQVFNHFRNLLVKK
jgi:hypothetical protein